MLRTLRILLIILCPVIAGTATGQSAYVNTQQGIFQLTGGPGNCSRIAISNQCGIDNNLLSIAVYKDTVYYNTWTGGLKRFKIGVPGSGETLIDGGDVYNAMTVDKNGMIYMANQNLVRYDPYTKQLTNLGRMPFVSMGDLAFYKDKLLLAGYDPTDWSTGIFEINIHNLAASDLFMSTPSFFGLISYPVACGSNKYFGLSSNNASNTQLIELDLVSKTIIGNSCTMPLDVLDAASSTETGLDSRVAVTDLQINISCQSLKGTVRVNAIYPGNSNLTYTLDNTVTNLTGLFTNVEPGQHTITVVAANGACTTDTSFSVDAIYNPVVSVVKTNPDNCAHIDGSIHFTSAPNDNLTYTLLQSGVSQSSGDFVNLRGGVYQFRISNTNGCSIDTSIALAENIPIGGCNDIFIPNAFTPNYDGRNDLFIVNLPSSFKNVALQLFNRWGATIYQAKGNSISWDGTAKGTLQPIGIYIYAMTFTDPSGIQKSLKGTLTLLR